MPCTRWASVFRGCHNQRPEMRSNSSTTGPDVCAQMGNCWDTMYETYSLWGLFKIYLKYKCANFLLTIKVTCWYNY